MAKKDQTEAEAQRPAGPAVRKLVLKFDAALGAGSRKRGSVIATAEAADHGAGYHPETLEAAEGVQPIEIKHLLLNPQLFEVQD